MRGKYSPTVSAAYKKDCDWWRKYAYVGKTNDEFVQFDPEGFDSYGYDLNDVDRAGNNEFSYIHNDAEDDDDDFNWNYDDVYDHWMFDGTKPCKLEH